MISLVLSIFSINGNSQTVSFEIDQQNFCPPAVVVFTNTSVGSGGETFLWDFDKGSIIVSEENKLTEVFNDTRTYRITLSMVSGSDTLRTTREIEVFSGPQADFTYTPALGCPTLEVSYSSSSLEGDATITSHDWDFRNGLTSNVNSPAVIYQSDGTYSTFLSVTDANGCTDFTEKQNIIKVWQAPIANFSTSDTFACQAPLNVSFINYSSGISELEYAWNFGNGNTSSAADATTTYSEGGLYNVSLTVTDTNNCSTTQSRDDYINIGGLGGDILIRSKEEIISGDSLTLCTGEYLLTTTLATQADYEWIINYNGNILTANTPFAELPLTESGSLEIMLIANQTTPCPDTLRQFYTVDQVETAFTLSQSYTCQVPFQVELSHSIPAENGFEWILPDGTINDTSSTFFYTIPWSESYEIKYQHRPTEEDIPFLLAVENPNGCRDTLTQQLNIERPVARIVPDTVSGCIPFEVNFSDSSKSPGNITERELLIDGISQGPISFPYTFSVVDTVKRTFQLVITNNMGCTDTSYAVNIHGGTHVDLQFSVSPDEICFGEDVTISNLSSAFPQGTRWQFFSPGLFTTGLRTSVSNINVTLKPYSGGNYTIHGSAEHHGCYSDTTTADFLVANNPTGNFTYKFDCDTPLTYTFYSGMNGADELTWTVDGQEFTDEDTLIYTFSFPNDYWVELAATNTVTGCSIVKRQLVKVQQVIADFTAKANMCLGVPEIFNTADSEDAIDKCLVEGYLWDFGDGSPPRRTYESFYEHAFESPGIFETKLIVTGDNGCTDTTSALIEVEEPPVGFTATPDLGCGPDLEVHFDYWDINPTITDIIWYFGDEQADSTNKPQIEHTYRYATDRTFQATLMVTDTYGCVNFATQPVHYIRPNAHFQAADRFLCLGEQAEVLLIDENVDFQVDFGDGSPLSDSLTHTYADTGTYDVTLFVERDGCSDEFTFENCFNVELASANFTVSENLFDCYPAQVNFSYSGDASAVGSGTWTFSDGAQSEVFAPEVSYTYTTPSTYEVNLEIFTLNGCYAQSQEIIEVDGPEADFDFFPKNICKEEPVQFEVQDVSHLDEFEWLFGDGESSTALNPSHTYQAVGSLFPALRIRQNDCEVVLPGDTLFISPIEAAFQIQPDKNTYCIGEPFFALNQSIDFSESTWIFNGEEVSTDRNLGGLAPTQTGENSLRLRILNNRGCTDSISAVFPVVLPPEFTITGDTSICYEIETASLAILPVSDNWSIEWTPPQIFSNANSPSTEAVSDSTVIIDVNVTDTAGCITTESTILQVLHPSDVVKIPLFDTTIYIGESIDLYVRSDNNDASYLWNFTPDISCLECNNPTVRPLKSDEYVVTIKDDCFTREITFNIEVIEDHYLELPTAFSPNDDGENDTFYPEHSGIVSLDFKIFNRWGNLVYQSESLTPSWDGTFKGKLQNSDTYTYYIQAKTEHGYEFDKKGTFVLMR